MAEIKDFNISDRLKNGLPVTIRAVRPDDKEKINEAFRNLEPETIYTRYFRYKSSLSDADLKWATELDFENDVAIVVTIMEQGTEVVIGGSRFSVLNPGSNAPLSAEIAFTVEEDYQGQGMASRLLTLMIQIAREKGIAQLEAEVLSRNAPMLAVFRHSGLPMKTRNEGNTLHLSMRLDADEA